MDAKGLMVFFEMYYGEKYSGAFLEATAAYLSGRKEAYYKAAAEVIVKRFSRVYGKAPGPAEFEKHMDEILAAMPKPPALPDLPPKEEIAGNTSLMDDLLRRLAGKNKAASCLGR